MRVLITGGAGFIGSNLADAYLAAGHGVTVIDNRSSGKRENVQGGAACVEMDINDPALEDVFSGGRFDLVNHHAAQIDVRVSVSDPLHDARINIMGLVNLLENCRKRGVGRFIFASSGGVIYGEPERLPAGETLPKTPLSPYGVSKHSGESYLFYYYRMYGMTCFTMRYSNVYGPRQDPHGEAGVGANLPAKALRGGRATTLGGGAQQRGSRLGRAGAGGRTGVTEAEPPESVSLPDDLAFNVGTGVPTSVNELAAHFNEITGDGFEPIFAPARPGELLRNYLDAGKIRDFIGWAPEVSIRGGLEITFDWFRERWEG